MYTLALEGKAFYVGWSMDPCTRIAQHFLGRGGSQWCLSHKPQAVVAVVPGTQALEDAVTIALMSREGWERVRGGKWALPALGHAPEPLRKARMYEDSAPPSTLTWESIMEHMLAVDRNKPDGPHAVRARIMGPRAAKECPGRGIKTLYAETEAQVRAKAALWLGEEDEDMRA